ncbi:MAG: type III secretion system chaperone [Alphaproteobacteria bacterium]
MSFPTPAHALAAMAKELGADGLSFDENGIARLGLNDDVVVALAQGVHENCLDIVAEIPLRVEELDQQIAINLLLANFRAGGPGLPTFSINPTDGAVLLSNSMQVNRLSIEELMAGFQSVVRIIYHYIGAGVHELRNDNRADDKTLN